MHEEVGARRASRDGLPALAGCLAAALTNDPFLGWVSRLGKLDLLEFFTGFLEKGFERDLLIYTVADARSVAVWTPPNTPLDPVPAHLPEELVRHLRAVNDAVPAISHSELEWIGTSPDWQGHGYGGELLRLHFEYCDRLGVASALRTYNPRSQSLYEKRGYTTHAIVKDPPVLPTWWMVRPAASR